MLTSLNAVRLMIWVHKIWEIRNMVGDLSNVYIDMANVEFIEAIKAGTGRES